jgi:hypothetical protein
MNLVLCARHDSMRVIALDVQPHSHLKLAGGQLEGHLTQAARGIHDNWFCRISST